MKPLHFALRLNYCHFLDPILEAGSPVVELGSGGGNITVHLLKYSLRLVEINAAFVERLQQIGTVEKTDVRNVVFKESEFVIGNIPFACTKYVLKNLLRFKPRGALLVLQQEVGERLLNRYGLIAALLHTYYAFTKVTDVPGTAFIPRSVRASILRLDRRPHPLPVDVAAVRNAYVHMRKCVPGTSLRPQELTENDFLKAFKKVAD